jgi:hypothetical protein
LASKSSDIPLIKAVLQRHVLETIFGYASVYSNIKNFNEPNSLEALIAEKAEELILLTQKFGKTREGNDSITPAVPIRMRQQIYSALGNRGFSNIIIGQETCEHSFINKFKTALNEEMEQYRKISNPTKKKEIEEKAANIILDVIRIFFFRIKTQEPIAQFCWFRNKDKIDPSLMSGMWDDDNIDDFEVDVCKFPLIGIELYDDTKRKIYTQAIIHPQKVQQSKSESKHEVSTQYEQDSKHRVDKHSNSESNFNVNSQYQLEQSQPDVEVEIRPNPEFKPKVDSTQSKQDSKQRVDKQSNSESNFNVNSQYQSENSQSDVKALSQSEFKTVETQSKPEFKPEVDNTQSQQDPKHRVDKHSNPESNFNDNSQYQREQSQLDIKPSSQSEFKTRSKPEFESEIDNTQSKQDPKHRVDKHSNSESNFNVNSQYQSEQTQSDVKPPSQSEFKTEETHSKPGSKLEVDKIPQSSQTPSQLQSSSQATLQSQSSSETYSQAEQKTEEKKKNKIFGAFNTMSNNLFK